MNDVVTLLQNSEIILTPTDTILGISCLSFDEVAVQKVNEAKNRPNDKNFILLVDGDAMLQKYVEVPDLAWEIMDISDKPVTIIYNQVKNLPQFLVSDQGTIAIRVVKFPLLQRIIQRAKQPIISTSANLSGQSAPKTLDQVDPQVLQKIDYILPECQTFQPQFSHSSIIQIDAQNRIKVIRA